MTDNKTLDLIIYRCEDAKIQSTFGLTLPPSFKSQSPFYQMRVLFPEHTAPAALFSFANQCSLEHPEIIGKIPVREQKRHRFTYLNIYQISYSFVK